MCCAVRCLLSTLSPVGVNMMYGEGGRINASHATAWSHHRICSCVCVRACVHFAYLPLLICRGELRRWAAVSVLLGERDRPLPWEGLECSDVSECISEMSDIKIHHIWVKFNIMNVQLKLGTHEQTLLVVSELFSLS